MHTNGIGVTIKYSIGSNTEDVLSITKNSDGEIESYDCLTMETAVVVKQATGSNYQYAVVKEEIVGLDYNRQSLTVE